jgi:hypothetical protein
MADRRLDAAAEGVKASVAHARKCQTDIGTYVRAGGRLISRRVRSAASLPHAVASASPSQGELSVID